MAFKPLGKYERLEELGRGTYGTVYLAKDTKLGRQVALKVMTGQVDDPKAYFDEARLLTRLNHPNIVQVHSADEIDGEFVIDMERVPGQSLRDVLRQDDPLPVERALHIIAQVLNALAHAHENHVTHRDIKPANILLTRDDLVKVVDFGIAQPFVTDVYLQGEGTHPYMAPEDYADEPSSDKRSDLWSVGVVLYEMLTGQRPFRISEAEARLRGKPLWNAWQQAVETQKPRPLSDFLSEVPNGLQGIVNWALVVDKQKRFQTANDFLDALKRNDFYKLPNTEAELRLINRFAAAYNRIDKHLRQELRVDRRSNPGFANLIREYAQQHPEWTDEKDLLRLAITRNDFTHELVHIDQYNPVPATADIEQLENIERRLNGSAGTKENKPNKAEDYKPIPEPKQFDQPHSASHQNVAAFVSQSDDKSASRDHQASSAEPLPKEAEVDSGGQQPNEPQPLNEVSAPIIECHLLSLCPFYLSLVYAYFIGNSLETKFPVLGLGGLENAFHASGPFVMVLLITVLATLVAVADKRRSAFFVRLSFGWICAWALFIYLITPFNTYDPTRPIHSIWDLFADIGLIVWYFLLFIILFVGMGVMMFGPLLSAVYLAEELPRRKYI